MDDVAGWGIEAMHRAIDGLKCKTAVHICYGYGIKANIDWKNSLGEEWRQYEKFFPALAKSRIGQVSLECINSHVPLNLLSLLDGKDLLVGVIDVATDKVETPEQVAEVIGNVTKVAPKEKIIACTNCGMEDRAGARDASACHHEAWRFPPWHLRSSVSSPAGRFSNDTLNWVNCSI